MSKYVNLKAPDYSDLNLLGVINPPTMGEIIRKLYWEILEENPCYAFRFASSEYCGGGMVIGLGAI